MLTLFMFPLIAMQENIEQKRSVFSRVLEYIKSSTDAIKDKTYSIASAAYNYQASPKEKVAVSASAACAIIAAKYMIDNNISIKEAPKLAYNKLSKTIKKHPNTSKIIAGVAIGAIVVIAGKKLYDYYQEQSNNNIVYKKEDVKQLYKYFLDHLTKEQKDYLRKNNLIGKSLKDLLKDKIWLNTLTNEQKNNLNKIINLFKQG